MAFRTKVKVPQKLMDAQEFVAVQDINDSILYTDKMMFAYIDVRSDSEGVKSKEEQHIFYGKLTRAMSQEKMWWKLSSYSYILDTQYMVDHLMSLKKQTNNQARLELLDGELDFVKSIAREGGREPHIFLTVWEKDSKHAESNLIKRVSDMVTRLNAQKGMQACRMDDKDISLMCKVFAELGEYHQDSETGEFYPQNNNEDALSMLINEITPSDGLQFSLNRVMWGGTVGSVYGASGYIRKPMEGWLTKIMNNTEAITSIIFNPSNPEIMGNALSNNQKQTAGDIMTVKDPRQRKNLERELLDSDALIDDIDGNNENIGLACMLTMPFSSNEEGLEEAVKNTKELFQEQKIQLKCLGQMQQDGFKALSPYYTLPYWLDKGYMRIMPLYTLLAGAPMCINSYQDVHGFYLAMTDSKGVVSPDLWHRGGDRTNSNFIALGKSGMGKSTLIKHILQIMFMQGVIILIIDPEDEYTDLTRHLGGSVFYAGGGEAKINIFQVRLSPIDDEEEDIDGKLYKNLDAQNDLQMHIKNLDTLFRTYLPDMKEVYYSVLETTVTKLYSQFGITWDTDFRKLKPTDYPIMKDFYELLRKEREDDTEFSVIYAELAKLFESAAIGTDSFIFNGHTNIDDTAQVQCYNIQSLQNHSEKIQRTQYQNLLSRCWDIMSRDKTTPVVLLCDEAYLLVDPKLPQSLMYLRNIVKRARKYEGALGVSTQSAIDLLNDDVRKYGQAIFDNSAYKYFMGADGVALKELTGMYDLTEKQQIILRTNEQRKCLAMLGNTMLNLSIDLPQYKLDNMGTGGGR